MKKFLFNLPLLAVIFLWSSATYAAPTKYQLFAGPTKPMQSKGKPAPPPPPSPTPTPKPRLGPPKSGDE